MRKLYFLLLLVSSVGLAEQTKTVFNPFTGKLDYITALSSTSLPSGSTQYIQNRSTLQSGAVFHVSSGTVQNLNIQSTLQAAGASGSSGDVLQSNGAGNAPTWVVPGGAEALLSSTNTWTASQTYQKPSTMLSSVTVISPVVVKGTITVTDTGNTNNVDRGLIDIFKNDAAAGDPLFSIGSIQQGDQFIVKDQTAIQLPVYGLRSGNIHVGVASFSDKVMSVNSPEQHVNMWSSGDLIVSSALSGDGGKDIIISPRTIEAMRISNVSGITVTSSMTVTAAGGIGVTYGVIVGSLTVNTGGSINQAVCWKTATTLGYCSTVVGAGGGCTCN